MSRVPKTQGSRLFPEIRDSGGALRVDAPETGPYGRLTQTIPVGETIRKDGAEGATDPGNSQANGPQEDGSLESGAWPSGDAPTDEVSRIYPVNLSGLRTEGVAHGAIFALRLRLLGDRFE